MKTKTSKIKYVIRLSTGLYHHAMYAGGVSKDRATTYTKRPNVGLSLNQSTVEVA